MMTGVKQTEVEEMGGKSGAKVPSDKNASKKQKEQKEKRNSSGKSKETKVAGDGALTQPLSNPIRVDHVPCIYNKLRDQHWTLSRIRAVCMSARKDAAEANSFAPVYGNTIFHAWENCENEGMWPVCADPSAPFLGVENGPSWETVVEHFLKSHSGDWKSAERSIRVSLDRYAPQYGAMFVKTRQLAMAISRCDPISLFRLSDEESAKTFCTRFWDKCAARNPRLLVEQRPIIKFWLVSAFILGYPWADPDITDVVEEFDALQRKPNPSQENLMEADSEKKRERSGEDLLDDEIKHATGARVNPNSPARGGFVDPNLSIVQEQSSINSPATIKRIPIAEHHVQQDAAAVTPTDKVAKPESDEMENWSNSQEGSPGESQRKQRSSFKAPVDTIEMNEIPTLQAKSVAFQELDDANLKNKVESNRQKFESDAEKARLAHQMRLDNLPRKSAQFFCLSVACSYGGEEEEDIKVQEKMATLIIEGMGQAMESAPDLMFLPIGDYQYTKQEKWIKDEASLKTLVSWMKLKPYLDLSWNNGHNFHRQGKTAGEKILRTRIRVAFDQPENHIESLLDEIFCDTGFNMGIYRSPLQVGNATLIGWLLSYPTGMSRVMIERELMRHFKFLVPIALELRYPANPGSWGEKWVPGIHKKAWHVYVPHQHAEMVENELSLWLTKSTHKKDMPFASSTQFVVDYKYATAQNKQDVDELGKAITQMISTHDNHLHTSCVIKPSFPIHALVKTHIPLFDKSVSLLRVLFSIQCIPDKPNNKQQATDTTTAVLESTEATEVALSKEDDCDNVVKEGEGGETSAGQTDTTLPADDDPKSPDKKKRRDNMSGTKTVEEMTVDADSPTQQTKTPERKKKGRRKRRRVGTPKAKDKSKSPSTPAQDLLTSLELAATPATTIEASQAKTPETADEMEARLLLADLKNFQPSPLFLLILPAEVDGYMIFVVRKKFRKLAESILNNLAAFLIYYLELWKDPEVERKTLRLWLCKSHIEMTTRYGMAWHEPSLTAQSELDKNANLALDFDDGDDWLTALSANPQTEPTAIFKGSILLNLKLASVKDIDDGATVVSRINEIRRLQQVARNHAEVVAELEAKEAALRQAHVESHEKDKLILQLQAQLAEHSIASKKQVKEQGEGKMKVDKEGKEDDDDDLEEEDEGSDDSEDENINGEIDGEDIEDSDDDEESSQGSDLEENDSQTGRHNETAQADAGGGSSGSGS